VNKNTSNAAKKLSEPMNVAYAYLLGVFLLVVEKLSLVVIEELDEDTH
jgi:hypothetical protein